MNEAVQPSGWSNDSFAKFARGAFSVTVLAAAVPAFGAAPTQSLRSPWDGKPVMITEAAYTCPAIAHIASDLVTDGFYRLDDPTHSIIDPARRKPTKNQVTV
jgi:poly(beta-D-mannuronate) lyase